MSSYEDIYEMASTFLEAVKNIHWRSPNIESLIDPVSEQLLLTISDSQNLVANPTLAAPTNIRAFLTSVFSSVQDTNNLITFIAFLIAVPLFSTFLVAMLTNVNIVLKALRLPLVRNPISASPLAVILLMVTIFGNIPLVSFFPARANQMQAYLPVQPGHYQGAIAQVMQIVAFYEQVYLGACVALQFAHILRHGRVQLVALSQPAEIINWLLSISGFALRMWLTRVSTDTATSPVQSGSTIWVWRKVILRTDTRYQTSGELQDDVFVWMAYFVTMFCFSSLVVKYALSSQQEGSPSMETRVIKVTPTSTVYTTSVGCQTTVTGEDWIPKSHIATDLVRVAEIEAVIDSDIKAITVESVKSVRAAQSVAEKIKQDTLRWQNDHTALNTHISALKEFRKTLERHEEDGLKQRELADKVSATVKRLEALIKKQAKNHEETFQACEKAFRARIDGLLEQIAILEKDSGEQTGTDGKNKASELDANLGPREAESHSVSANTPELQGTSQASVTIAIKPDAHASSDPMLPSPPLSPPNAEGSDNQATSNSDAVNSDADPEQCVSSQVCENGVTSISSASIEMRVGPEKGSDSEMDAANGSVVSDNDIMEEIGNDTWSRVQKFKFRNAEIPTSPKTLEQHFTIQEIQEITDMLLAFRANHANDVQRQQISALLNAGFPHRKTFQFTRNLNFLSIFLDMAEINKQSTKERVYTELHVFPYAFACGIHPQRINLANFRKSWRSFFETQLPARMEEKLEQTSEEDKAAVKEDMDKFMNTMTRLFGQRAELWKRDMIFQASKLALVSDMNLVARRLLENLGLLKFREVPSKGTCPEEYIPPSLSEFMLAEQAPSKPIPTEESLAEDLSSPGPSPDTVSSTERLSVVVPEVPVETSPHSSAQEPSPSPCEPSPTSCDTQNTAPTQISQDIPSTPVKLAPISTVSLPKNTPTKATPARSAAPDWAREVREEKAQTLQEQSPSTGTPNSHRNHHNKRRSHGGKGRRGGGA